MKKRFFLIILLILFFTLSLVSANENSTNLGADNVLDVVEINQISDEPLQTESTPKLYTADLVKYYKNDSQFEFKVSDSNDTPLPNQKVILKVNDKQYEKFTDEKGMGKLNINFAPGDYIITTSYNDISKSNTIKVLSRFSGKNITSTYGKETTFSITVLTKQGTPMKNKLVTFTAGGKSYGVKTDSKGVASLKLNFNAGKYTIKYSVDGISSRNTYTVKNYYKLKIFKWNSGADVLKNKKIKSNVPNSKLVKKVVDAAKSGTPLIKFKGGSGKTVFITSGVHGSELSSQVAAMQLIEYMETHPVKGTVYIMPFMNPKATSKNVRNYGVNLNSNANKKGTISYKTVKLIVKYKCDAYGDFHCTMPGGKPGKDVAMGSYLPTAKSAKLAKYISKKSKVTYLIYKKAATEYPGALEDMVNLKHIPSVTCEVITPHGTIAGGTVPKSLSMMKSLLKYNSLI